MSEAKIRVLVVDDHELFRGRLVDFLQQQAGIDVVATAANGHEAVELARSMEPDVIVMDIVMPILDGLGAARQIMASEPGANVIILSMHHTIALAEQAQKDGVAAYVMKQKTTSELVPAIRAAHAGGLSG